LPIGWWLGGTELALTVSINLSRNGTSDSKQNKVTWLWILLILTAGAALTAALLLRRGTPRHAPTRSVAR
jgi:hypothetical protein